MVQRHVHKVRCRTGQLASDRIHEYIEISQIGEVAELLGHVSCTKGKVTQQNIRCVWWELQLASDRIPHHVECFQIDKFAELLGQFSFKKAWSRDIKVR